MNLRAAYQLARPLSVFLIVSNLFDANYGTFGVLGDPTAVLGPGFTDPRFVGPGAPRAAWVGLDVNYCKKTVADPNTLIGAPGVKWRSSQPANCAPFVTGRVPAGQLAGPLSPARRDTFAN